MFHRLKQTIAAHPVALALIFFLFYFAGFFGLEQLISQPKYIIYCGLDSLIPFNEWFIFAYGAWFALIPWALIALLIRDRSSYFYLCAVMFSGMAISLLLYLLFPNGVQLRPETIAGDNIAASLMQMVWAVDTSTNVCPSIHVSTTVAIFLAVRRSRIWQRRSLVVGGCGGAHLPVHRLFKTAFGHRCPLRHRADAGAASGGQPPDGALAAHSAERTSRTGQHLARLISKIKKAPSGKEGAFFYARLAPRR